MIEVALSIVVVVAGAGGAGQALAGLNDRRHAARDRRRPPEDPKLILELRLAKGEIDESEYTRRARLLAYGPPLELGSD